jgi:hypothetical protein
MNTGMLIELTKLIRTTLESTRGNVKAAVSARLLLSSGRTLTIVLQLWNSLGIGHDNKSLTLAELAWVIYKDEVMITPKRLVRLAALVSRL